MCAFLRLRVRFVSACVGGWVLGFANQKKEIEKRDLNLGQKDDRQEPCPAEQKWSSCR